MTFNGDVKITNNIHQFSRSFVLSYTADKRIIILNDHIHLFPTDSTFPIITTYSNYVMYIVHKFPGIDEERVLLLLEQNGWNAESVVEALKTEMGIANVF